MKTRILSMGMVIVAALLTIVPMKAESIKGNGEIVTKEFPVEDFDGITLGGVNTNTGFSFMDLFRRSAYVSPVFNYEQGASATLKITTDENVMPYLEVVVKNGNLKVRTEQGYSIAPTKLVFDATSKELEHVYVGGGGDFYLKSPLKGEELEVSVSGGGDLYLNQPVEVRWTEFGISGGGDMEINQLTCESFSVGVSGGGDLDLGGKAAKGEIGVSGGGDVYAYDMLVDELSCEVSGGGTAKVHALKRLNGSVSGGGDLYYKGNPDADTSTSGGGSIRKVK